MSALPAGPVNNRDNPPAANGVTAVKFLTKAERERLRKELCAKERAEKEEALKIVVNNSRNKFEALRQSRAVENEAEGKRLDDRKRREESDRRNNEANKKKGKMAVPMTDDDEEIDMNLPEDERRRLEEEKERDLIRQQYLGNRKDKKKIQKPSEKFRNIFQFDWDNSEDTTKGDYNPLYHTKHEPQLLFGRGFRAGLDVREQRRKNMFYDALARKRKQKLKELEELHLTGEAFSLRLLEELSVTSLTDGQGQAMNLEEFKEAIKLKDGYEDNEADTHWSQKPYDQMTDRDWRIFREDFSIYIKGGRVPNPMRNWKESGLPKEIQDAVTAVGYEKPTPIQMQSIPIALEMRDLIGIAETGSGKTAAFMLPMLAYVEHLPRLTDDSAQSGPYGLVLAPSRELALQIRDEADKFAGILKIRSVAIVGGRSAEAQAFELRRGAEIVIGTPGRMRDCLEKAYTVLIQCNYVVLDEADRMIDLGFEDVVNWILDQIPSTNLKSNNLDDTVQEELAAKAGYRQFRVTQMFSATMPASVERLARRYLRQPAIISVGTPGSGKRAIEQVVEFVSEARKKARVVEILSKGPPRVMIFVNQKKNADVLVKHLQKQQFSAVALHGGKTQDVREDSLESFRAGLHDVLVATDVAGRGIDVEDVQLVVNYDMPKDIEAYTHRIGRTGRAGKKGKAISFLTEDDSQMFYDLKQLLVNTNNPVPHELSNHAASKQKPTPSSSQRGPVGPTSGGSNVNRW